MNTAYILTTVITVLIAGAGWVTAHYFSSKRDRYIKRREVITTHLINAYKILAIDIANRDKTPEFSYKLESIIAELQLFGSEKQIQLAKQLVNDFVNKDTFSIDDLINDLRHDLRIELELAPTAGNVEWLRLNKKNNTKST